MKRALATLLVFAAFLSAGQAAAGGNGWGKGGRHGQEAPVGGSTIAINEAAPYVLGQTITFTVDVEPLQSWEYPLVTIACFQDVDGDGVVTKDTTSPDAVYVQLDLPETAFVLGGGSSPWLERGGGPAECNADLWAYPGFHDGDIRHLAGPVEFHAEG